MHSNGTNTHDRLNNQTDTKKHFRPTRLSVVGIAHMSIGERYSKTCEITLTCILSVLPLIPCTDMFSRSDCYSASSNCNTSFLRRKLWRIYAAFIISTAKSVLTSKHLGKIHHLFDNMPKAHLAIRLALHKR